jgi:hypothetical protein
VLRIEQGEPGRLVVVSRLARPRVLAVLAAALLAPAALLAARRPALAVALVGAAALLVVLGGRSTRARLGGGQVTVEPALPFARAERRPLDAFRQVVVESVQEARARRSDALAERYRDRSSREGMPSWLRPPVAPGTNDHLRRLVLLPRQGAPLPLTAWLPPDDDLEGARRAIEVHLG